MQLDGYSLGRFTGKSERRNLEVRVRVVHILENDILVIVAG